MAMRLAVFVAAFQPLSTEAKVHVVHKHAPLDEDAGEEYEYGDTEAAAADADSSDYSVHQFISKDEARDAMGSDDSEADAAANDAQRSVVLSKEEPFNSEEEPSPDNFLQKWMTRSHRHIGDDDGGMEEENQYEVGDVESASGSADTSDYSVHQFIAKDEARDPMGSDDREDDAAKNEADRSKILSEDTFDSEDEPSPDNFLQRMVKRALKRRKGIDDDGDMDEYEYGDVNAASGDADTSNYGIHQFIAKDEARDSMGSDDDESEAASYEAQRSKILSQEDTFDSEDEPSPDNFLQKLVKHALKKKGIDDDDESEFEFGDVDSASGHADLANYGVHQFISKDEARDPMGSDDDEADAAKNEAERSTILSNENEFDSEDEPSPDNFLERMVKHALKTTDVDVEKMTKHEPENFLQRRSERARKITKIVGSDDDSSDEFEYGDSEAASGTADTSDYGTHQFLAKDEARDPMGSDDSEADAAHNEDARSKILAQDDTFNSEDEPSPDN